MKKICIGAILSILFVSPSYSSFLYEEIDPICSITGTTHISFPWEVSDTSSWEIPKAYDGKCYETPNLLQSEKEYIYMSVYNFFRDKDFVESSYGGGVVGLTREYSNTINNSGKVFVKEKYFPYIQNYIVREIKKESPNYRNIAIVNYAASIIGYDYYIQQPE